MNGITSSFIQAAELVRQHHADPAAARTIITEKIHRIDAELKHDEWNTYLIEQKIGYQAALEALYKIDEAKRKIRA